MSITVSNSSPLINLARIDRFDLLRRFYGAIVIPPAVYEEVVVRGSERDGAKEVRAATWIQQVETQAALAVDALGAELDHGEAAAILLSRELSATTLLIDEIRGRRIAARLGIHVTGTIGILTRAKRESLISSVKDELDKLRQRGTWIDERLYAQVLTLLGEWRVE